MGAIIGSIGNIFKFHKLKIAAIVFFALLFTLISFPYRDLSGILPTKIYEWSGNQVYVQFEDFGLNPIPLGLSMNQVLVEATGRPPIEAGHLDVSPWILGALTGKSGASIDAQGLFGGAVVADYREGDKTKAGNRVANVAVDAQGIQIPLLIKYGKDSGMLNLNLIGTVNLSTQAKIDAFFGEQPSGEVEATFKDLALPAQILRIPVQGGEMQNAIPEVKIGPAKLAAKMGSGNIDIQDFTFGGPKDTINGKLKGQIGLMVKKDNLGTRPQMDSLDLTVDMTMKSTLLADKSVQLATLLIQQYGKPVADGTRFQFKMKLAPGMALPQFSAIQ